MVIYFSEVEKQNRTAIMVTWDKAARENWEGQCPCVESEETASENACKLTINLKTSTESRNYFICSFGKIRRATLYGLVPLERMSSRSVEETK